MNDKNSKQKKKRKFASEIGMHANQFNVCWNQIHRSQESAIQINSSKFSFLWRSFARSIDNLFRKSVDDQINVKSMEMAEQLHHIHLSSIYRRYSSGWYLKTDPSYVRCLHTLYSILEVSLFVVLFNRSR